MYGLFNKNKNDELNRKIIKNKKKLILIEMIKKKVLKGFYFWYLLIFYVLQQEFYLIPHLVLSNAHNLV